MGVVNEIHFFHEKNVTLNLTTHFKNGTKVL